MWLGSACCWSGLLLFAEKIDNVGPLGMGNARDSSHYSRFGHAARIVQLETAKIDASRSQLCYRTRRSSRFLLALILLTVARPTQPTCIKKSMVLSRQARGIVMLKPFGARAEARTATIETGSLARPTNLNQASEKLGALERSDDRTLTELAVAERRVSEINACVDRQRQLIKQLAGAGKDITSAQIMLDSLIVSLFLAAEDRHRLRAMLNTKEDKGQA